VPNGLTRKRLATATCLVTAIGLVVVWAWLRAPHGTVEHFDHWLSDGCLSVDHEKARLSDESRQRGLVGADRLICNNLGGGIEVLRFETPARRQAAAADPRYRDEAICSIGTDQLIIDELLISGDRRQFASWCMTLHGRVRDGRARRG
jgi:hypothetical protein